jgi:hypothetical protein
MPTTPTPKTPPPLQPADEQKPAPEIIPDDGAALPAYVPTEADKLLDSVFGDHVHDNDRSQLDGGVDEDRIYQKYWQQVAGISPVLYAVSQCRAGKRFLSCVTALLRAARGRHCNSEK